MAAENKYGVIFEVLKRERRDNLEVQYLDETSQIKAKGRGNDERPYSADYFNSIGAIVDQVDYLSKEDIGTVHAAGFIRKYIAYKEKIAPEKLDNERRKDLIHEAMNKWSLKYKSYRGKHFNKWVFSMSEDLMDKITRAGGSVDDELVKMMKNAMRKLQQKHHKGFEFGYAWGIHHDTDNTHLHVLLCNKAIDPKTKNPDIYSYIGMSKRLKNKNNAYVNRKEPLADMLEFTEHESEKLHEKYDRILQKKMAKQNYPEKFIGENETLNLRKEYNTSRKKAKFEFQFKAPEIKQLDILKSNIKVLKKTAAAYDTQISERYDEYNHLVNLIISAKDETRDISSQIKQQYQKLGQYKSVKYQKEFYANPFSKALFKVANMYQSRKREETLEQINKLKDLQESQKIKLQMILEQRKIYLDHIALLKQKRSEVNKQVHNYNRELNWQTDKYNEALFLHLKENPVLNKCYQYLVRKMAKEKKAGNDISALKLEMKKLKVEIRNQIQEAVETRRPNGYQNKPEVEQKKTFGEEGFKFQFNWDQQSGPDDRGRRI